MSLEKPMKKGPDEAGGSVEVADRSTEQEEHTPNLNAKVSPMQVSERVYDIMLQEMKNSALRGGSNGGR
jgi:hypothetical protein